MHSPSPIAKSPEDKSSPTLRPIASVAFSEVLCYGKPLAWNQAFPLSSLGLSLIRGLIFLPPSISNGRAHFPKWDKGSMKSVGMM